MKLSRAALLLTLTFSALPAFAGPATDSLTTCFTDNTTGRERKDLARWIFIAMATHPDMRDLAAVTPEKREASNKGMAALVTRLVTENCVTQARAANIEGTGALGTSFGLLAKVAMQELTADPGTSAATQDFVHYIDMQKFETALRGK